MELTPRTAGLIRILLDYKGVLWTEQSKCYKNITFDLNSGMRKRFTFANLQKEERSCQTTTFWFQSTDWGLLVLYVYYLAGADRVRAGAGWWSQETEAGLQAGAGGGLDDSGQLRTALPRAHWEETPSETELCLSEDLSPSFSIMWLLPAAFQRWLLPWPFFCFLLPKSILSFSSTLLHKLVYLKKKYEGWFWTEVVVLHSATWGIPHLCHRERFEGWMLERWPYWHTSVPLQEEERGKSILCCLQEFTLIGESLKTTTLAVHFVENFFSRIE